MMPEDCPDHVRFEYGTNHGGYPYLLLHCERCGSAGNCQAFVSAKNKRDDEADDAWNYWILSHEKCPEKPRFGMSLRALKDVMEGK